MERKSVRNGFLVFAAFALMFAPVFATTLVSSAAAPKTLHVHGIWSLSSFNSTVLKTVGNIQYGAGVGVGPLTGGIHGSTAGTYLTRYNMKTQVILFTVSIVCTCTVDGRSGTLWISGTNGIDHNASDPNGKTTANLAIVGAQGGLKGITGTGRFVTTTSSNDMNYTMTVTLP